MSDERDLFLNWMEKIRHPSYYMKLKKFQVSPLGMENLAAIKRQTEILSELLKKGHKIY
jgi:hypothetical protein